MISLESSVLFGGGRESGGYSPDRSFQQFLGNNIHSFFSCGHIYSEQLLECKILKVLVQPVL